MIAEMLEIILTGTAIFLLVAFTVACYYIAYRVFKDYREDTYMKGDKTCIYAAAALVFCAVVLTLVLLLGLAQEMGW